MNRSSSTTSDPGGRDEVLVGATKADANRRVRADKETGWRILGLLGLLLAVIGLVDALLYLYPPAFESPEWEFGTMAAVLASLPLPTVGLAALGAWAVARGGRIARIALVTVLFVLVVLIAAAYVLFLLDVPLALGATAGPQGPTIYRAIVRTTVMGVGFGIGYLIVAIIVLRSLPRMGQ